MSLGPRTHDPRDAYLTSYTKRHYTIDYDTRPFIKKYKNPTTLGHKRWETRDGTPVLRTPARIVTVERNGRTFTRTV